MWSKISGQSFVMFSADKTSDAETTQNHQNNIMTITMTITMMKIMMMIYFQCF